MKVQLNLSDCGLIHDALTTSINKIRRESKYDGVTRRRKTRMLETIKHMERIRLDIDKQLEV